MEGEEGGEDEEKDCPSGGGRERGGRGSFVGLSSRDTGEDDLG